MRALFRACRSTHRLLTSAQWLSCILLLIPLQTARAQVGIEARVPWTASRIQGTPEPPLPFTTRRAYPALQFNKCLDITTAPGSDRLFVVEQNARILSFPARGDVQQADLVVDLRKAIPGVRQTYAIAFHPEFQSNRYCYICYIKAPNEPDGTHVARFEVSRTDPPTIDVGTETTLLTWVSGGHNGCCLKFGPDGYLYVSTGDAAGPNPPDPKRAGQDVTNILSAILRIDVDQTKAERNYRIPPDNPFVDLENARKEIWAYGFRNPWRMSFDRQTGDLWVGDVGWELWELLDRVEKGGNYGWSIMEGRQPTNPEWPRGPTAILPPTIEHPHCESSSITDGFTYYGSKLNALAGHHIYGDYDTGRIWGFRYVNGEVTGHRELADTQHRIVGFGEDHQGELLLLDHTAGTLHELVPNTRRDDSAEFPRRLSETGLFESAADLTPAPGVFEYSINAARWADYATAQRVVAVPGNGSIQCRSNKWQYPKGTVLAKTLSLEMQQGVPATHQRIETQILHFDGKQWRPYSYRWNHAQTDAALVPATGDERVIEVRDSRAPGGIRRQTWRFSGRAECQRCHNLWSGPPLGFSRRQLDRTHRYAAGTIDQLTTLAHIKLLAGLKTDDSVLVNPHDDSASLSQRARSYLHVNCAHCHRLHAGGAVLAHMPFELPLEKTNMLNVRPSQGAFGIHDGRIIKAGDPFRSILYYRMAKLGGGRMPHISSSEVDQSGLDLIHDWIAQMPRPTEPTEQQTRLAHAETLRALTTTDEAADSGFVEKLLSSPDSALLLVRAIDRGDVNTAVAAQAIQAGTQHSSLAIRDLFERFLPPGERTRRLGVSVEPKQILALAGDARSGERVFFETAGVACRNCHVIGKRGKELGPDLTQIGSRLKPAEILEAILEPSRRIDPKYVTHVAETTSGRVFSGLIESQTDDQVVLRDANNKRLTFSSDEIEQLVPQQQSIMPELLFRDLTAQQLADLVEFLSQQKHNATATPTTNP